MPKVSEMIQSKFLRKEDFDEDRILTIKGVKLEDMPGDQGDQKWVLYFREEPKGMALNVTTIRVLEQAFGDDSDKWIGNRVKVYVDPNVRFGKESVEGLRISPSPPGKKQLTPENTKAWASAKAAYRRDGDLKKVLARMDMTDAHQQQLMEECDAVA